MKLGIIVILIGVAWCARCYLLRSEPQKASLAMQQQSVIFNGQALADLPAYHPGVVYVSLPDAPKEGETIEYTHWSAPDPPDPPDKIYSVNGVPWHYAGGTKHSHIHEVFMFTKGKWVAVERYPKDNQ